MEIEVNPHMTNPCAPYIKKQKNRKQKTKFLYAHSPLKNKSPVQLGNHLLIKTAGILAQFKEDICQVQTRRSKQPVL